MKVYKKPEVRFESFALSESIATACDWTTTGGVYEMVDQSGDWAGVTIFNAGVNCSTNDGDIYCITQASDSILSVLVGTS